MTVIRLLVDGAFLPVVCAQIAVAAIVLSGMENQYADLAAQMVAPTLLGSAALVAALLAARLWHSAALGGVAVLTLGLAFWPQVFPGGPSPEPGAPIVRIYSANVHLENKDAVAIRRSVLDAKADIVVLVELGPEVTSRLDEILAGYPYRAPGDVAVASTTVMASRWPVTSLPSPSDGLDTVISTAQTPLGPIHLAGTHLTRPWPFQESWGQISQTMALEARLDKLTGAKVLVGDFNSVSSARIGRQIRTEIGLHPAPGFPGTWPSAAPAVLGVNIDQVYASPDLAFVSRALARDNGSDHRPVITEITRARR
ncbi:MAG: endonuclease [Brevundimonas sp.]|nr:MAG: endonuclease [Brevundimonas sp.]